LFHQLPQRLPFLPGEQMGRLLFVPFLVESGLLPLQFSQGLQLLLKGFHLDGQVMFPLLQGGSPLDLLQTTLEIVELFLRPIPLPFDHPQLLPHLRQAPLVLVQLLQGGANLPDIPLQRVSAADRHAIGFGPGLRRFPNPLNLRFQPVDRRRGLGLLPLGDQPADPLHHLILPRQGLGGEENDVSKHLPRQPQMGLQEPPVLPGIKGILLGDIPARFEIDQLLPLLLPIEGADEAILPIADFKADFSAVLLALPRLKAVVPGGSLTLVHTLLFRTVQQSHHSLEEGGFPRFVRRFDQIDSLGQAVGLTHPPPKPAKEDPQYLHPRITSLLKSASSPLYKARFKSCCSSGSAARMRSSILRTKTPTTPVPCRNWSRS